MGAGRGDPPTETNPIRPRAGGLAPQGLLLPTLLPSIAARSRGPATMNRAGPALWPVFLDRAGPRQVGSFTRVGRMSVAPVQGEYAAARFVPSASCLLQRADGRTRGGGHQIGLPTRGAGFVPSRGPEPEAPDLTGPPRVAG